MIHKNTTRDKVAIFYCALAPDGNDDRLSVGIEQTT